MTHQATTSMTGGEDSNGTLLLASIGWWDRLRGVAREAGLLAVVILLMMGFGVASPNFLSGGNILAILLQASVVGILALGQTFVLITGGIDLSVGSIVAVSAVCSASLALIMPVPLALVLGIVIGGLAGLINGLLIMLTKITPFIVTLGTMSIYAGLALIITGGRAIYNVPVDYENILSGHIAGIPIPIILVIALTVIAALVIKFTRFGEYLIAVGGNKEVARLAGIRITTITVGAYIVSGAAAGLGGEVLVSRLGAADPTIGGDLLLVAIAATVMGGTKLEGGEGSMVGALIGAILLAALTAGLTSMNVQAFYQQVAVGAAIIIALLVDQIARRQRRTRKVA